MALFQTLFNLVETIFISWLGESRMVAISYAFPVQTGVFAILEGAGNGVTAFVGRRLGENDVEAARRTALCGLAFVYAPSLVRLPFLFQGPSNAFFRMPGASDLETLQQAWLYSMWIPPMPLVISFTCIVNAIFRCRGDAMTPLRFFLVANSLNFALDPLFIFVLGMGVRGAAWALRFLCGGRTVLRLRRENMRISRSVIMPFVALGNSKASSFLALLRKIILRIPFIYIMPHFFDDKVFAIFLAEPAADFIAVAATVALFSREFRRLPHSMRERQAERSACA